MDLSKKRRMDDNGAVTPSGPDPTLRLTPDDARAIIEPFTRDQLLEIVQNAAVRHPDVLSAVRSFADLDLAQRKLFVRGLGWDTTSEKLRNLFSAYGDLEEAIVITDKVTGKSKGYGFVIFKHVDGALLALKQPSKQIDGRMAVAQLASLGNSGSNSNAPGAAADVSARKIYVGNVPPELPADRLLAHFASYGEIEEGPLGFDWQTGKSRGFALFVYKTAEAARASLVDPVKMIDGYQLLCKLAIEGKKGRSGGPAGPGGVGDGLGMPRQQLGSHYGGPPLGPTGISSYNSYSGGLQGPPPLGQGHQGMNPPPLPNSLGGVSSGPDASSYGGGISGPYNGSPYGGPAGTGYGGLGNAGGSGLGNAGAGGGSSLYSSRLPTNSAAMPLSGGYGETGHYGLASSGYSNQHHQPAGTGTSPAPRVTSGGMYQASQPYY